MWWETGGGGGSGTSIFPARLEHQKVILAVTILMNFWRRKASQDLTAFEAADLTGS